MSKNQTCPICHKPTMAEFRPFCSRRCADIDLGRWFSQDYRVPGPFIDEEPETGSEENEQTRVDLGSRPG
ncbi:DNA gyrase inhibitor YacG [Acetobacter sp. LMG 1636]|uniref:DNA gyrase inhibitor YacG n=2 Tax=Acetobacter fallax TaxID=1737473 RepID=A0ABX0K8V4_9PROT|nr:DNA gyrase inhibitor YacG [Acetobacter fallax]NHO36371.1 DNA gyrase inhibitor YacG [Acetobacter fallax]